jgi:hypothetical protein
MRRVIAIAVTGLSLGGCSSFSLDYFKPTPSPVLVQLESAPPGADAVTSLGPGCKTPCSVSVPAPDVGFAVTFAMPRFQPVTVPVQVIRIPGDFTNPATTTIEPSPVFAELKPLGPPPKVHRPKPKPRKPKAAAAPAAAGSAFPNPTAAPAAATAPPPATAPAPTR